MKKGTIIITLANVDQSSHVVCNSGEEEEYHAMFSTDSLYTLLLPEWHTVKAIEGDLRESFSFSFCGLSPEIFLAFANT